MLSHRPATRSRTTDFTDVLARSPACRPQLGVPHEGFRPCLRPGIDAVPNRRQAGRGLMPAVRVDFASFVAAVAMRAVRGMRLFLMATGKAIGRRTLPPCRATCARPLRSHAKSPADYTGPPLVASGAFRKQRPDLGMDRRHPRRRASDSRCFPRRSDSDLHLGGAGRHVPLRRLAEVQGGLLDGSLAVVRVSEPCFPTIPLSRLDVGRYPASHDSSICGPSRRLFEKGDDPARGA